MLDGRKILCYLAIKYQGNWDEIYQAIKEKEPVKEDQVEEKLSTIKSKYITYLDDEYREIFRNCYKPPFVLFYYGDINLLLNKKKKFSIVGSREASKYGLDSIHSISGDLSEELVIVSGMAKGIDTAAHEGAISKGGQTIAVLGSGIDYCYPSCNRDLYEVLKESHLIISEYPNNTRPNESNFPFRNRLIALLGEGLLVGDAKQRSGTLITVGHALKLGKDVMCIPHQIGKKSLCNQLIKDGACLVEDANDIFSELGTKIYQEGEQNELN